MIRKKRSLPHLRDFIPQTTRAYQSPTHLEPYLDILERAPGGGLREAIAAPPQHAKSESTLHAIVKMLIKHPDKHFIYTTYAQERADRVQNRAAMVAQRAGLRYGGRKRCWSFPEGGQMIWTSFVGGQITGEPLDGVFFIDDPYKDRKHANSASYRMDVQDTIDDVVETRVHRGGSIILMATRWVPTDLTGYVRKRGWGYTNLKALNDGRDVPPGDNRAIGEALWPHRKTRDELLKIREINQYSFESMYQGEPRPRDAVRFGEAQYYTRLPTVYKIGYGLDLAYTAKSSSDWSVLVTMAREVVVDPKTKQRTRRYYVLSVDRKQTKAPDFANVVKERQRSRRATAYFYAAGTERGAADFMISQGCDIHVMNADRDKFLRSEFCADAWNAGRILMPDPVVFPDAARWHDDFLEVLQGFTGVNDPHDDDVDALVSGFDGMQMYMPIHDDSYDDVGIDYAMGDF